MNQIDVRTTILNYNELLGRANSILSAYFPKESFRLFATKLSLETMPKDDSKLTIFYDETIFGSTEEHDLEVPIVLFNFDGDNLMNAVKEYKEMLVKEKEFEKKQQAAQAAQIAADQERALYKKLKAKFEVNNNE